MSTEFVFMFDYQQLNNKSSIFMFGCQHPNNKMKIWSSNDQIFYF